MVAPRIVGPPKAGLWRVGRGHDPLRVRMPEPESLVASRAGNRFDDPTGGTYGVLYFGSTLRACFGETVSRFRPSPAVVPVVEDEWRRRGWMALGSVPAEWRFRRSAVRVETPGEARFLDVESVRTREFLSRELASGLAALGYDELDVAVIRGPDRRVTRMISLWAAVQTAETGEPLYAGIRYLSRLSTGWECWAVYADTPLRVVETRAITRSMSDLQAVAKLFGLTIH